jgi:hypothetical protein
MRARPPQADRLKVASLRRESSNQLLETLEEWNDYLERQCARSALGTATIICGLQSEVPKGFQGSWGLPRKLFAQIVVN